MGAEGDTLGGGGDALQAAVEPCGPNLDEPYVIAMTGATVEIDVGGTFGNLKRLFTLRHDGDNPVWFAWTNTSGKALNPAAVSPAGTGRCAMLPGKERFDAFPTGRYLLVYGTNAELFRIFPSSGVHAAK